MLQRSLGRSVLSRSTVGMITISSPARLLAASNCRLQCSVHRTNPVNIDMQPYERIIDADADGTHGVELVSSASGLDPSHASEAPAADIAAAPDTASLLITLVFLDTPSVLVRLEYLVENFPALASDSSLVALDALSPQCHAQAAWTPADLCSHLECLQQYAAAGRTIRFVYQVRVCRALTPCSLGVTRVARSVLRPTHNFCWLHFSSAGSPIARDSQPIGCGHCEW